MARCRECHWWEGLAECDRWVGQCHQPELLIQAPSGKLIGQFATRDCPACPKFFDPAAATAKEA